MTRQGFAQAREKIRAEALRDLNDMVIDKFEAEDSEIKTYKGYRLFAVDGSDIDLPNTELLRKQFGFSSNNSDKQYAKGLAMVAFDVLNKLTIFAELYRYDDSEKKRIMEIVDGFSEIEAYKNSIFLLDRGYPSFKLFNKCINNNQKFLVRVSSQSLKEINACNKPDTVLEITRDKITIKVRVVKITLSSGETETLVTNLDDEFTVEELNALYAKRSLAYVFREFRLYSKIRRFAFADSPNRHFPRPLVSTKRKRTTHPKSPL